MIRNIVAFSDWDEKVIGHRVNDTENYVLG